MVDFAPPPVEDEPARHTVNRRGGQSEGGPAGGRGARGAGPCRASAGGRTRSWRTESLGATAGARRLLLAVAIAVGATLGRWVGWRGPVRVKATEPAATPGAMPARDTWRDAPPRRLPQRQQRRQP